MHRYLTAPLASATRARYISEDCATAVPFHLPDDFLIGEGRVTVDLVVPDSHGVMAYVALDAPAAAHVIPSGGWRGICQACVNGVPDCQTLTPGAPLPVGPGTVYGQLQLFATAAQHPPVVSETVLAFTP